MTNSNPHDDMAKLSLHLRDCVQKADGNWAYVNIDVLLDAAEYLERFAQPEPKEPTNEEIVTIRRAAEEAYYRQELAMSYVSQACIEAAEKRCAAIAKALPHHAGLLSRIQDVVVTELNQVTSRLLAQQFFTKEAVINGLRKEFSITDTP